MTTLRALAAASLAALLCSATAHAGIPVRVTIDGEVEFNGINFGPLSNVNNGDAAQVTFLVDSDLFVNNPNFPTRGYEIDGPSFQLSFPGGSIGIQNPYPGGNTPQFVIRDNDPAVDGFMVSDSQNAPVGVSTSAAGQVTNFKNAFHVTYGGDLLPSLDIEDALGHYDFTGLTVFNWTLDDGPFQAMGLIFGTMDITIDGSVWTDEGCELDGVAGDPRCFGLGDLSAGSNNAIELDDGNPSALSGLFLSGGPTTPVPFKGGTLKPVPFLIEPLLLPLDPLGGASLPFIMPPGVPSGLELMVQFAIDDPAAVKGVSLSNAIQGVTP
jgi:hypothetical protein